MAVIACVLDCHDAVRRLQITHEILRLIAELASKAAVSVGRVYQVTNRLQEQGYLERTPQGRHIVRPRKPLRGFAQQLKSDYVTNRKVVQAFSELTPKNVTDSVTELCVRRGIQFAFTLASGLEPNDRNVRAIAQARGSRCWYLRRLGSVLKELARSSHTMSLEIYVLLSVRDRERDSIDRDCISVSWFTVVAFCTPWVCTKDNL